MKRISKLIALILCAFSCAACGASKSDSSSVSQDSAVSQLDNISTEQGSAADENIAESSDMANSCAEDVFTATETDRTLEKAVGQN